MKKLGLKKLGKTGLRISPFGFGGYRVLEAEPTHLAALEHALTNGINLIDTSANYTNGSSERAVGKILGRLFEERRLARDQVVVVTKAGYLQGQNLELAQARERAGNPFPEMTKLGPDLWHSISPEFLADQIGRSLERMGLEQIDVMLLHNPEYFLKAGGDHGEYYRRIEEAFKHLEEEVAHGRIAWYGVSSNTFPEPKESDDYTSLETLIEIAEKISPENHFAVIQCPFNLYEPGAAFENNNSGKSVFELAQLKNIGTLINRPLNAFAGNRMIRLASYPEHSETQTFEDFRKTLSAAMDHERRYAWSESTPLRAVAWGHVLQANLESIRDLENWKSLLAYRIRPELEESLGQLGAQTTESREWAEAQRTLMEDLFTAFTAFLETAAAEFSRRISTPLVAAAPGLADSPTLSQKALRVYRSIPGLDCILVGMRSPAYVDDVLNTGPALDPEAAMDALDAVPWELAGNGGRGGPASGVAGSS